MIDTGSSRSFISPKLVTQYFENFKYYEPFEVISTHATSKHDEIIYIPLFPTFNSDEMHKFYIYDVDGRYDGLIGSDLLKQLDTKIDMKNLLLHTNTTKIPIIYNPGCSIKIAPRCEQRVRLPTNLRNGQAIMNYKIFCDGVRMPSAIVRCENGFATTVIQNIKDREVTLNFLTPVTVTEYNSDTCEINNITDIDMTNIDIDSILTENLNNKLRLDHMNEEEKTYIRKLCSEYKDIFYSEKLPLTFTNDVKHQIRTRNEDPIFIRPYRQPQVINDEINRQVEKMLENNIVTHSHSPWSAPVHLVPKKMDASNEKKYRLVIDYRKLNEITIDDKYPLPNITDLFDKLGRSCYFSTLDLASGYHQIEVAEKDRQKTAFSTNAGHYEFTRMPFGLKTAPATFQRTIDNVLRGLQGIHCLVYLDDIIVYSSSLQEHLDKLRTIFDRLRKTNLKVQLDKSEFLRKEVLYLGHTITSNGLKPNNDKIKAVLNYPLPRTTTEIKSFLGLIGYYRRFIKDFAKITQPMTARLKKKRSMPIDDEKYIAAFQKCKELLVNAPILQYPDPEKPYILTTDASEFALGAILSQGTVGNDKPVAYASRTLNDAETRYSVTEKELLAIVWAVKHFRPYLYGRKFTIVTDHKPLTWLNTLKETNSRLTRWRLRLSEYDFNIIHKSGKLNNNADALSRIKINALDKDNSSMKVNVDKDINRNKHVKEIIKEIENLRREPEENLETMSISDTDSERTLTAHCRSPYSIPYSSSTLTASEGSPSNTETAHSAQDTESKGIPILQEAIDTKPNQILVYTWLIDKLSVKNLSREKQRILEVHLPVNRPDLVKQFLKEYIKNNTKYFIYFEDDQHRRQFTEAVIFLFKKEMVQFFECTKRVVFIENELEQKEIVEKYHTGKTCHRGIRETLAHIKRTYFWHKMEQTVSSVINSCEVCKRMKYDRKPLRPTLQLTQTQTKPLEELFIDLFTIEGHYYLTIIDAFSKLGQALEITNRSTPEVVRALIKYFSFYGIPQKISSDPGTEFNNALLKELLAFYKIDLHISTPNNPNSMGLIERFHSTILEIYRLAKYEQKYTDAASIMTYAIMAYNQSIHSSTGYTPFEIFLGHTDSRNTFDVDFNKQYIQQLIKEHAKRTKFLYKHISEQTIKMKEKRNEKRAGETEFNIKPGDTIFSKNTNKRISKDKPRYQKAIVTDDIVRNTVPVQIKERSTKVPLKNIKRPSQAPPRPPDDDHDDASPRPSTSGIK